MGLDWKGLGWLVRFLVICGGEEEEEEGVLGYYDVVPLLLLHLLSLDQNS